MLAGGLWLAVRMFLAGAPVLAGVMLSCIGFTAWVYTSRRTGPARYLLPGLAAFALFVVMPLVYTVYIAFTNFSGSHLLSRERVQAWFAQDLYAPTPERYPFRLYPGPQPETWQVAVSHSSGNLAKNYLISRPFTEEEALNSQPVSLGLNIQPPQGQPASIRQIIEVRPWLNRGAFHSPRRNRAPPPGQPARPGHPPAALESRRRQAR